MYNECQDCDRMDCRDRGCIAPTSASNSSKINHEYTKRPRVKIPKSRDLYEGSYTLNASKKAKEEAEKTLLNSAMSKLSKEELEVLKRNLNK